MCQHDPTKRIPSFADVEKEIRNDQFVDFDFSYSERKAYKDFADELCAYLSKIESGVKYVEDISRMVRQLESRYRTFMLEPYVPDPAAIVRCFLNGTYYYKKNETLSVNCVYDFLRLLKSSTEEKRRLILANLHTRLDTIPRYTGPPFNNDDIPF